MQATLFKFAFRSLNPGETVHYEYLFQKEEADRKKEEALRKKRIREVRNPLQQLHDMCLRTSIGFRD
jgi:hypothetical protein